MFRWSCLIIVLLFSQSVHAQNGDECEQFFANFSELNENGITRLITYSLEQRVPLGLSCAHALKNDLLSAQILLAGLEDTKGPEAINAQTQIYAIESSLSEVEEDLKTIAKQLDSKIRERCGCGEEILQAESRLVQINQYFNVHLKDRIYVDHNDYDRYFFSLSIGYEYNSINEILADSSPRVGLLINHYYGRRPYKDESGFGYRGVQLSANMTFSGEKEQKTSPTAPVDKDNKTLGFDLVLFSPLHITKVRQDLSLHTGPLAMIGVKQTDEDAEVRSRNYIGFRSGFSPEHFLDVTIGKSPGLDSTRMEVRGQMPVARLAGGSLFYIGIAANIGIANEQDDEEDVITTYFSWSIDFTDMLATGG